MIDLVVVSTILILALHKEIFSALKFILKILKFKTKKKHEVEVFDFEPISLPQQVVVTPVSTTQEEDEILPYQRAKLGADLIIRTNVGSGRDKVRLVSYIYDGRVARRVVVDSKGKRTNFSVVEIQNINSESEDFKAAYKATLNPTQQQSKPSSISPTPVVDAKKPIVMPTADKKLIAQYQGRVVSFGFVPYKDTSGTSYAVDLMTDEGQKTLYGTGLERVLLDASIQTGDYVVLSKFSPIPVHDGDTGSKTSKAKIWTVEKLAK